MILIPEQIACLRERRRQSKQELEGYRDYLSSKDITSGDYFAREVIGDGVTDNQFHQERRTLLEITELLENSEYLKTRNTEEIAVGTKFKLKFDDSNEEEEFILVENITGLPIGKCFISTGCPLGKSVKGKKEGERFSYVLSGGSHYGNTTISGTITQIEKDLNNYTNFIRSKNRKNRICREAIERKRAYKQATTKEELEEYKESLAITKSQRQLLRIEAERLVREPKTPSTIQRLATIKRILENVPVAEESKPDGKVSIGEKVTIAISKDGEELETRVYEMINEAVSDEVEGEYLERISPLGSKVYGLKVGDTFTIRENRKNYNGVIVRIEEQKTNVETANLTSTYQYHK